MDRSQAAFKPELKDQLGSEKLAISFSTLNNQLTMASLKNQTTPDPVKLDQETFAVVWAALQNTYEGTNVTRTVSRLLHLYHPEDGILAYERLLRTLNVLLKNFDTNGFRILVSIIPPPADVLDSKIQEVFKKTTGFSRIIPSFYQTYLNSSNEVDSNLQINNATVNLNRQDNMIHSSRFLLKRGKGSEKCNGSTQIIPISGNYVSQSYHTCDHNTSQTAEKSQDQQNTNSASSSIDYGMNWITPYLLRKNAISQSTQMYRDPLVIFQTVDQKNLEIPMSQENHPEKTDHTYTMKRCLIKKDPACNNSVTKKQKVLNTEKMDLRPEKNLKNKNLKKINKDSLKKIEKQNLNFETKIQRMQRAIQEDIYKMDVVQQLQTDFVKSKWTTPKYKDLEAEDLVVNEDLSKSIENFLKRVKSSKTVYESISPKPKSSTQTTEKIVLDENAAFINCWKEIITREVLSRDLKSSSSDSDKNSDLSKEKSALTENASTLKKESEKKVYRKKPNPATRPKSERVAQRITNRSQVSEIVKNEELNVRFETKSSELNSIKVLQQKNAMSELSNYKKQYYDALLNVQRAKVAVANSLATSSTASTTKYNPYYYNHLQHQHQLVGNQKQILLRRQFLNQRPLQTVPNNQNSTTSRLNSNKWSYPSFGQVRLSHKSPAVSSGMKPSVFCFVAQDTVTGEIRHYGENECNHLQFNIKTNKLKETVENLKEPENVSIPQSSSSH